MDWILGGSGSNYYGQSSLSCLSSCSLASRAKCSPFMTAYLIFGQPNTTPLSGLAGDVSHISSSLVDSKLIFEFLISRSVLDSVQSLVLRK